LSAKQTRGSDLQNDGLLALLLLLLLFIVQPVLLGIAADKAYQRSGILWGILAFGINAGILAFFENQFTNSVHDQ
jgi:hypothetical protein